MIEVVEETGSTNADLVRRLGAGEFVSEGHWLRALRQTGGRGRRGREWVAPEGNLTASTVVNLRADDPAVHTLAFVAALAVHDVVSEELSSVERPFTPQDPLTLSLSKGVGSCAAPTSPSTPPAASLRTCFDKLRTSGIILKWPNDVLVGGAKICGILLERCGDSVVAGIGINVAAAPEVPGRATTSLHANEGRNDAATVLAQLAARFAARLAQWRIDGLAATLADWQRRASPPGTPLVVSLDEEGTLSGGFAGLDPDGALRLRLADGSLRVIHAGDVSLV